MNKFGINEWLWMNFVNYFRPNFKEIKDIKQLNLWEVLVVMNDGERYIYDDNLRGIRRLPFSWNDITAEEFKKDAYLRMYTIMRHQGLSYEDLAKRTGISSGTISNYVNGRTSPTLDNLFLIAKALGCGLEDLMYIE